MAIKSLNSVGGFSVKDGLGDIVIIIDDNGNINTPDLTVIGLTNLGDVSNITIDGGSDGYVLSTDGAGNLSWTQGGNGSIGNNVAVMPFYIATSQSYTVQANFQGLFGETITIDGTLQVIGDLVDVTGGSNIVGNGLFAVDNVSAAGNVTTGNLIANISNITDLTVSNLVSNGTVSFTTTTSVDLGDVSNLTITGGSNNQVLSTDGTGNLSWIVSGPATMPYYIFTGTTVIIPEYYQGLYSYPITVDGTIEIEGVLIEV